MEYRQLGKTGLEISALSFGASSLGSVFRNINEAEGIRTVHTALDLGLNFIDVSPYYGLTKAETVLGKALKRIDRDLQEKEIGIINASPLSMGLLSNRVTPDWHPAPDETKQTCAKAAAFCRDKGEDIVKLAVQFSVANPNLTTTLVGTASAENIEKNVRWVQEPMNEELLAAVLNILAPIHNKTWSSGRSENN
jgi:aryl-alcohol dehydrogenase-like predicted oxidoreductase